MQHLFLDCSHGMSGDMTLASLAHLGVDLSPLPGLLAQAGVACRLEVWQEERGGGPGCRVEVSWEAEGQPLRHPADIAAIFAAVPVSDRVRHKALAVLEALTLAEAEAHGIAPEEVHFHEVGAVDTLVDILGACWALDQLGVERVTACALPWFGGSITCAHGEIPLPAPATANLMRGLPVYPTDAKTELVTPTGAALLRHFVKRFGPMPVMAAQTIGYGMGKKEFAQANCVRAFWGETADRQDEAAQLSCNLDDMTGEDIAFAAEQLLAAGALDVWTQAIGMKKGRPGVMLCCLCRPEDAARLGEAMLRHTTTLGVRKTLCTRQVLERENRVLQAGEDTVRVKIAAGAGARKAKLEYEDLAAIARRSGETLAQVRRRLAPLLEE